MHKFGLVNSNPEVTDGSSMTTSSEDDTALSIGGGLEAGTERFAFYADYDFTQAEPTGIDVDLANLTLGVIFKY